MIRIGIFGFGAYIRKLTFDPFDLESQLVSETCLVLFVWGVSFGIPCPAICVQIMLIWDLSAETIRLMLIFCFHFIENDLLVFDFETFRLRPFVWDFQTGHLLLCIFLRSVSFGVQGWEVGVHRQWKRQLGKAKGFGYANSLTR